MHSHTAEVDNEIHDQLACIHTHVSTRPGWGKMCDSHARAIHSVHGSIKLMTCFLEHIRDIQRYIIHL